MLPGAGLAVTPHIPRIEWLRGFEEVLSCVEGWMCILEFSDLEFFACLSYIRS